MYASDIKSERKMDSANFEPKKLVDLLESLERTVNTAIAEHCPAKGLHLSGNVKNSLDDFFNIKPEKVNDVAFISTQLAMLHLQQEINKTRDVIVDSNDLRAYYDYTKRVKKDLPEQPLLEDTDTKKDIINRYYKLAFWGSIILVSFILYYNFLF